MKKRHLVLLIPLVVFGSYCVYAFNDNATPYVSIQEASEKTSNVQVKGTLDRSKPYGMEQDGNFHFFLIDDEGKEAEVVYHGLKPDDFDQSVHIVAIGKYENGVIESNKLLIKCPSKYEGKKPQ